MYIPRSAILEPEVRGDTNMQRLPGFEKKEAEVVIGNQGQDFVQPVEDPSGE